MVAQVQNNTYIPAIARKTKYTFDRVLSSKEIELNFVYVRDYGNKVIYSGYILDFNCNEHTELFLRDVIVYDFEFIELYKCDYMYIPLTNKNFTMEFNKCHS